jgi:BASS family bile acid:Na+ symporter
MEETVEISVKMVLLTAIKAAIVVLMVSLGMETTPQALLRLWRHPRLLAGSLVAAFVVVPLVAYGTLRMLPLSFGTKAGLWAVSITPGAPMIYRAAMKRGVGNPELAASFQVTVALLVILLAPAWLAIVSAVTGGDYGIAPAVVLKQVSTIQLIPILLGMALHGWLPCFAQRAGPVLVKIGNTGLIVLAAILVAVMGLRIVSAIQIWTIIAAGLIAAAAIVGGHLLAGPEPANRLTIANANAQRNAGLALTITAWSVPEHRGVAVVAVVVYLVIALVMTAVYTRIYGKSPGGEPS